ncbi:MAG: alcohol dehydrogenase catalytic domain-containing protein [Pseudomonadota bacterium]
MLTSRAAVALEPGPLTVTSVSVSPPGPGEVLVRMLLTTIDMASLLASQGKLPGLTFPTILGKEGVGVVVDVGPDVESLFIGDMVVPISMPECGQCPVCLSGRGNLCHQHATQSETSTHFTLNEQPCFPGFGPATFSEYTVIRESALARLPKGLSPEDACFLGGVFGLGVGAVLAVARLSKGDSIAVFGANALGLSVIQGAILAQAGDIFAIDTDPNRLEQAQAMGATHTLLLDPTESIATTLLEHSQGGVSVAFECWAKPEQFAEVVSSTNPAWGMTVLVHPRLPKEIVQLPLNLLYGGRSIKGAQAGGIKGRTQLYQYGALILAGQLHPKSLMTHRLPLAQINTALALAEAREGIRIAVDFT